MSDRPFVTAAIGEAADAALRHLADTMPQMVWITRPDGYHVYYNQQWWEYTGLSYEEAKGEGWNLLLHPDDRERSIACWQEAVRTMQPYEIEYRFRRASDGEYRWFLGRALPQRDENGVVVRWFGTCTDIHDQKLAEQALRLAKEETERASAAKDAFLATLSHELRTPLSSIVGWVYMLQKDLIQSEKERRDALDRIEESARLQAQLIEDMLDVSRIINGKMRLDNRPVDIGALVEASAHDVLPYAAQHEVSVSCDVAEVEGTAIDGDPSRLQQVFSNLLTNAIKFTPAGGSVQVRAEKSESVVTISFTDTGIGMDASFLPHVFERFRQAESDDKRAHGGLGLGLAIVSHLVERHGGHVRAESDGVGRGSRFTVTLPIAHAPAPIAVPGPGPNTRGLRIDDVSVLVVEDDRRTRQIVTSLLRAHGARVHEVASAEDGWSWLEDNDIDVLVSDVAMPRVNGYQLVERLRASDDPRRNRLPSVALTAFASVDDRSRALAAGFDSHLAKPVEAERLIETVRSLAASSPRSP